MYTLELILYFNVNESNEIVAGDCVLWNLIISWTT